MCACVPPVPSQILKFKLGSSAPPLRVSLDKAAVKKGLLRLYLALHEWTSLSARAQVLAPFGAYSGDVRSIALQVRVLLRGARVRVRGLRSIKDDSAESKTTLLQHNAHTLPALGAS